MLRARRRALGLSQRALGERAGVAQPIVSILESGWAEAKVSEALLFAELEHLEQLKADAAAPTDDAAEAAEQVGV